MHEMGGVRELEWTLVHTLMAEFVRLQLILSEDLTKSLSALRSELETSSEALSSDLISVLNLHSGTHPKASAVRLHEGEPTPDGACGSQKTWGDSSRDASAN